MLSVVIFSIFQRELIFLPTPNGYVGVSIKRGERAFIAPSALRVKICPFQLVADSDTVAGSDELRKVYIEREVREACHPRVVAGALRQRDS